MRQARTRSIQDGALSSQANKRATARRFAANCNIRAARERGRSDPVAATSSHHAAPPLRFGVTVQPPPPPLGQIVALPGYSSRRARCGFHSSTLHGKECHAEVEAV